eukprot:m.217140 g.217140  ORF g.217140 m.217140 type:complete len:188 (-) comp16986_c10_seq1:187-750(-)
MALLGQGKVRSYGSTQVAHSRDMCFEHVVEDGDSFASLAIRYDVTVDEILHLNRLFATDNIHLRKTLLIPSSGSRRQAKREVILNRKTLHENEVHDRAMDDNVHPPASISPDDFLAQFDARFAQVKTTIESSIKDLDTDITPGVGSAFHTMERKPHGSPPQHRTSRTSLVQKNDADLIEGDSHLFEL